MRLPARQVEIEDQPLAARAGCGVEFSRPILEAKLQRLSDLAEASCGGLEDLVDALCAKQSLFAAILSPESIDDAGRERLEPVVQSMFPVRRKFGPPFLALDDVAQRDLLRNLLHGTDAAHMRMERFVEAAAGGADRKIRRAAWDFAAECLHFSDPERYPLMTRWVWDATTGTGALREFVAGGAGVSALPIGGDAASFRTSRRWFTEQLTALGCYRELNFMTDLVLAQAYGDYMQAMSFNVGMVTGEMAGNGDPLEFLKRLTGIDGRGCGRPLIAS